MARIVKGKKTIGFLGLGYVGLHSGDAFGKTAGKVIGFDVKKTAQRTIIGIEAQASSHTDILKEN